MRCEPALEHRRAPPRHRVSQAVSGGQLQRRGVRATERTERAAAWDIFELSLRLSWRRLERCRFS